MLQVMSNTIVETPHDLINQANSGSCYPYSYQTYWMNYPVYITTDKTKKAIEILKTLQAEKLLECKSVNKFIELVEKISNIL